MYRLFLAGGSVALGAITLKTLALEKSSNNVEDSNNSNNNNQKQQQTTSSSTTTTSTTTSADDNAASKRAPIKKPDSNCEACGFLHNASKATQKKNKKKHNYWNYDQMEAPGIVELGNGTWTLLHTMATYYPENPSEEKKQRTRQFLEDFSHLFPCEECAEHLRETIKKHPVQLESRAAFEQWMCQIHNQVNIHLGKPKFDCNKTRARWHPQP